MIEEVEAVMTIRKEIQMVRTTTTMKVMIVLVETISLTQDVQTMIHLLLLAIQEAAEGEIWEVEEGDKAQIQADLIQTLSPKGTSLMETW